MQIRYDNKSRALQCSAVSMLRLLQMLQMLLLLLLPPNEGYLDPLHQVYTYYVCTCYPVSPTRRSRMKVLSPLEKRSCSCNRDPDYLVLSSAPRCPSCGLPPLPNIIVNAPVASTLFHHCHPPPPPRATAVLHPAWFSSARRVLDSRHRFTWMWQTSCLGPVRQRGYYIRDQLHL